MQKANELLALLARVELIPDPEHDLPEDLVPLREKFWTNMRFVREALGERGVEATEEEAASIWLLYLKGTHSMHTPTRQDARLAAGWFLGQMGDYRILLRHPNAAVRLAALAYLEEQHRDWAEAYLRKALAVLPAVLAALDRADGVLGWWGTPAQEVIVQMAIEDPDTAVRAKAISLLPRIVLAGERLKEVANAGLAAEAWPVREALVLAVAYRVGPRSGEDEVRVAVDLIRQGLQDVHMVQLAAAQALEVLALRTRALTPDDWESLVSLVVERGKEILPAARDKVLAAYAALGAGAAPFFRRLALAEDTPSDLRAHGVYGYLMTARDEAIPEVRFLWDVPDLRPVILSGLAALFTEEAVKVTADLLARLVREEGMEAALAALTAWGEEICDTERLCRFLAPVSGDNETAGLLTRLWMEGQVGKLSLSPACRPYLAQLLPSMGQRARDCLAGWALGYPPDVVEKWG